MSSSPTPADIADRPHLQQEQQQPVDQHDAAATRTAHPAPSVDTVTASASHTIAYPTRNPIDAGSDADAAIVAAATTASPISAPILASTSAPNAAPSTTSSTASTPTNGGSGPTRAPSVTARGATTASHALSTSPDSSSEGYRMSPAAARRFARRSLRRASPTPDLVTSLVRPPSPDAIYVGPELHARAVRQGSPVRAAQAAAAMTPGRPASGSSRKKAPVLPPHISSLDLPKRYGGACVFDLYCLSYVSEPDPALLCPICHDPMVDPVVTPCDHTFCYRCLRRSLSTSPAGSACPIDREPLLWSDCSSAARLVRTQLNNLLVHCPHSGRGCSRQMRREAVELHAETECRFRDYLCLGGSCEKRLRRKPQDEKCRHHEAQCTYCEELIIEADRELHLLGCVKSKTRCQDCWELVSRSLLAVHAQDECIGVEVGCPYAELGCPVRMIRGEVLHHAAECAFHPDTPSGIIIRTQRDLIHSYGDVASQLQDSLTRQEETDRRVEELLAVVRKHGGGSTGGLSGDPSSGFGDSRTMQDLDSGFEEIHQNLTHLEARQSMWTLNQVMPIREEVAELRNNVNMIRMHVNWLLNWSRDNGRSRAANGASAAAGAVSSAAAAAAGTIRRENSSGTGDTMPILPERRRSSGPEMNQPRL